MTARALLRYAFAETRRSRKTLAFCVASIALGVMAIVAVRTVVVGLERSFDGQARELLGADLELSSSRVLDGEPATSMSRELVEAGAERAELWSMRTMLSIEGAAPRSTRLVELHAFGGGYPFYGDVETEPAGIWDALDESPRAVLDPVLMGELEIEPGDRIRLGDLEVEVAGRFAKIPGSPLARFGLLPSVYVDSRFVEGTSLLGHGSRVSYRRLFRLPDDLDADAWKHDRFEAAIDAHIEIRTAREAAAEVRRFLGQLGHFLTLVGVITLLLGALGIGSAMNVFIRGKLDSAAVFRCLGATSRQVLAIYALLALGVGAVGSVLGAALGAMWPPIWTRAAGHWGAELLPARLELGVSPAALGVGIAAGIAATAVFTLIPVLRVARVAPLRVMRRDAAPLGRRGDAAVWAFGLLAIVGFAWLSTALITGSVEVAAYFCAGAVVAAALLAGVARLVAAIAARVAHRLPRYTLRQGIANLHRPGNQTASTLTAIGVGVLLISLVAIVAASIQRAIAIEEQADVPNVFLVDIQPGQLDGVRALLDAEGVADVDIAPMVAARIAAVGGRPLDRADVARDATERGWEDRMLTREYLVSYRAELSEGEQLAAGRFWEPTPTAQQASLDAQLASRLGVELGETISLDIQGLPLEATVTSTRDIRWQTMRPNAMILLSPGPIEDAPRMYVASFRIDDETRRYALQARLVQEHPNISAIDVTAAAALVRVVLGRVSAVLGFVALFSVAAGAVIVGGAIAAGRFARVREAMLLKVLGARRGQLRAILAAEYGALAALGALCGWLLAELLSRPALALFFDTEPVIPYRLLAAIGAGVVALNVAVGFAVSRGVSESQPLAILREE